MSYRWDLMAAPPAGGSAADRGWLRRILRLAGPRPTLQRTAEHGDQDGLGDEVVHSRVQAFLLIALHCLSSQEREVIVLKGTGMSCKVF
jgi:hypothetical protein